MALYVHSERSHSRHIAYALPSTIYSSLHTACSLLSLSLKIWTPRWKPNSGQLDSQICSPYLHLWYDYLLSANASFLWHASVYKKIVFEPLLHLIFDRTRRACLCTLLKLPKCPTPSQLRVLAFIYGFPSNFTCLAPELCISKTIHVSCACCLQNECLLAS